MATAAVRKLTLAEFEALPEPDDAILELDEGEVVEVSGPKLRHSRIAKAVYEALEAIGKSSGAGEAFIEATCRLAADPPTVRRPDVAFVKRIRLEAALEDEWIAGAPDLAVEIASPSDSAEALLRKARQYLAAGGVEVWIVYPQARQIHVHRADGSAHLLQDSDRIGAPDLFRSWSVPVADLLG